MKNSPFEKYSKEYDQWFLEHEYAYKSELKAVKHFVPENKESLEIGVGTGKFASPLKIKTGIDPSQKMLKIAEEKGIEVYQGKGEDLPFSDKIFELVLMVTTICFLDDPDKTFKEIRRVLKENGRVVIGFVDKESQLGQKYQKFKSKNVFYKPATFYSAGEVQNLLEKHNFSNFGVVQTVFGSLDEINEVQDFKDGSGEGGFVVIRAEK